jgi:hypothetical protein
MYEKSKNMSNDAIYFGFFELTQQCHITMKQYLHFFLQWYNFKEPTLGPTTLTHILILYLYLILRDVM